MGDALVGHDTATGELVVLKDDHRPLGVTVIGRTGYGKTTLLEHLILQDIAFGTSCIVVDAHGDLTNRAVALAPPDARERIALIEVWDDRPFRLNLFACPDKTKPAVVDKTVDSIVQVFKKLFGNPREYAPRLERDLGHTARTVIANNGTLGDIPRLFWDQPFRQRFLANVTNPQTHIFWQNFDRIGRPDRQMEQLESTINRLDQFLASELIQQMTSSSETTLPLQEVLRESGQTLLLRIPQGAIGEKLCNFLGALFLTVLNDLMFTREKIPEAKRPRLHLYLDEYGRFATSATTSLLTEGRKFGIGTTIAHQTRSQLQDPENRAAELQVGALVCFRLIAADSQDLAGNFPVRPEPQWEERVEEIEGTEPVLTPTRKPVEFLLEHSVTPAADDAARMLLVPVQSKIQEFRRDTWIRRYSRFLEVFEAFLDGVNTLLVEVMDRDSGNLDRDWFIDRSARLFADAPEVWEIDRFENDGFVKTWGFDTGVKLIREFIDKMSFDPKTTKPLIDWLYTWARVHAWRKSTPDAESTVESFDETWDKEHGSQVRRKAEAAVQLLGTYSAALYRLGSELLHNPILTDSGRVQPRKRVRYIVHPQRTYQDVQNELAQELSNLDRYTALVRTPEGMHRVKILKPAQGPISADAQRIAEEVRQRSKERYGRPWDEGGGVLPTDSPQPPNAAGPAGQQAVPKQPEKPSSHGQQAGPQPPRPTRSRKPPRKPSQGKSPSQTGSDFQTGRKPPNSLP